MGIWDKFKNVKNFITGGGAMVYVELLNKPQLGAEIKVRVHAKINDQDLKTNAVYFEVQSIEKIMVRNVSVVVSRDKKSHVIHRDIERNTPTWSQQRTISPLDGLAANGSFEWTGELQLPKDGRLSYQGIHAKHIWQLRAGLHVTGTNPKSNWVEFQIHG